MEDTEFWAARRALKHLYENSAANLASPWHILALALEGALQQIPYSTVVETHRDYGVVPNFACVLYGRTGSGKSSAQALSRLLFEWEKPYRPHGVRSGEGVVDFYGEWGESDINGVKSRTFVWNDPEHHAGAFLFDEVSNYEGKSDQRGSTMISTVLSMVTGETIGGVRAGGNDSTLNARTYRATLSIGAQPSRCQALLSRQQIDSGVAGRFLWMKPGVKRRPDENPGRRAKKREILAMKVGDLDWPAVIPTDEKVLDELYEFDRENSYEDGSIEKIDGHRSMNTLKVAAALAVLDSRANVTEEDWRLAQHVMKRSDEVRSEAIEAQHGETVNSADEKGIERALAARAENDFVKRVGEFTTRAMEKGFLPGSKPVGPAWQQFRELFNKKTRPLYMESVVREMQWRD